MQTSESDASFLSASCIHFCHNLQKQSGFSYWFFLKVPIIFWLRLFFWCTEGSQGKTLYVDWPIAAEVEALFVLKKTSWSALCSALVPFDLSPAVCSFTDHFLITFTLPSISVLYSFSSDFLYRPCHLLPPDELSAQTVDLDLAWSLPEKINDATQTYNDALINIPGTFAPLQKCRAWMLASWLHADAWGQWKGRGGIQTKMGTLFFLCKPPLKMPWTFFFPQSFVCTFACDHWKQQ